MKRLVLIYGLLVSSFSFGAEWSYVASSSNGANFFIDKDFYVFDEKNKTTDVWVKSDKKSGLSNERYAASKALIRFSCTSKKQKYLAETTYDQFGGALTSSDRPDVNYKLIFPDTIAEELWVAACASKGKGLKLPKVKVATMEDLERLFPPSN